MTEYWKSAPLAGLTTVSSLFIVFTLLNNNPTVSLQCRPAKVDADNDEIRLGIAFEHNPPETRNLVVEFVEYVSPLLGAGSCEIN